MVRKIRARRTQSAYDRQRMGRVSGRCWRGGGDASGVSGKGVCPAHREFLIVRRETVSCYLRHVKEVLAEAGVEVTPENRKQIDRAFHELMGVRYKDCPATWRKLKQELAGDAARRRRLVQRLKKAVRTQAL